jgi:hypothetical protein
VVKRRDVDRLHIQDREKWKRETAQKIKETKIKMMKLTGMGKGQRLMKHRSTQGTMYQDYNITTGPIGM